MLPLGRGGGGLRFALFGVPITIQPTFLFVALFAGSATGELADALVGAAVVLLSILGHELGHAVAAQAYGMPHPEVTIHGFGGHTHVPAGGGRWRRLSTAAAGPIAGFAIGLVALGAGHGLDGEAGRVAEWAWSVSLFWSLANLAPILPLDGGRVLVELLPGTELGRLRTARVVSVGTGTAAALAGWWFDEPFVALFAAWFAATNLVELRRDGWRGTPRHPGLSRRDAELQDAFRQLHPGSAAEAEAKAWQALSAAADGQRHFPTSALVAALLMQGRHGEAAELLGTLDRRDADPYLRTIAELGPAGSAELDRRLDSPSAAASDLDVAMLGRIFAHRWLDAAELAESDAQGRMQKGWLELATSWAFHAGQFEAAARLGLAIERRDAAATTPYNVACSFAHLGRVDDAVAAMHRAIGRGWADLRATERDDDLAPLLAHPGWPEVRAGIIRNQRRPARERGEPFTMPAGAAMAFLVCAAATLGLVRILPSDPDVRDRFGGVDVGDLGEFSDDVADRVVALDAATGDEVWRSDRAGFVYAAERDLVVAVRYDLDVDVDVDEGGGSGALELVALDPDDGEERWRAPALDEPVLVPDGVLAFDAAAGETVLLDADDGTERWRAPGSVSGPADDATVLLRRRDLTIAAVALRDGAERWVHDGELTGTPPGQVAPLGSTVLLVDPGPVDSEVVAVEVATGADRWRTPGNRVVATGERHAYVMTDRDGLTRVDLASGAAVAVPGAGDPFLGASVDGTTVLGNGDAVVAVDDASGGVRWRSSDVVSFEVLGSDVVLLGLDGLRSVDLATGSTNWAEDASFLAGIDADAGIVLVVDGLFSLTALDLDDGDVRWRSEGYAGGTTSIGDGRVFLNQ